MPDRVGGNPRARRRVAREGAMIDCDGCGGNPAARRARMRLHAEKIAKREGWRLVSVTSGVASARDLRVPAGREIFRAI